MTPDVIADQALLTASRWQRDAMLNRILAAWWQGKDDGLPAEQRFNDNIQPLTRQITERV